ncbi:hypothetical protein VTK26DRAFT_9247 [Humicola hyalothermophila]
MEKQHKEAEDDMDVDSSVSSETMTGDDDGRHDPKPRSQATDAETKSSQAAPPSPSVTHALEAALDGMLGRSTGADQHVQQQTENGEQQTENGEQDQEQEQDHPEWEADSSPYESSSESSSSDNSSDDDSEDEGGYPLLGVEETARLLMAADGENDGEGEAANKHKGVGAALRTKNEMPEEVLPKPDVTITPEMKIEQLGNVEFIVENTVVIKSQKPGEIQVLDSGSVLCTEDRKVVGALAEVLGNVRSPMYTVGFATEEEIKELGLAVGMPIFYSVEHANYVFTQPLKAAKGTDASNLHDEEVPPEEMEFSDDEKEAEHKRQQRQKKRGGKAGRGGRDHANQPGSSQPPSRASGGLNYDEDDDGPYRPLARPAGFAEGLPASLPPRPEFSPPRGGRGQGHRGAHRGGRADFRGRNNRPGFRVADRRQDRHQGGGGGSYPHFGRDAPASASPQSSFSTIPSTPPQNPHLPPAPFGANPPAPPGQWGPPPPAYPPHPAPYQPHSPQAQPQMPIPPQQAPPSGDFTFNYPAWNQTQGQQYQYPQAAPHYVPPPPPQPQPQPQAGFAPPPFIPPAVPPAAPPAAPPAWQAPPPPPAAGDGYNPGFYNTYQHAQAPQQPQQPGQHYWPQPQQHGAFGQSHN